MEKIRSFIAIEISKSVLNKIASLQEELKKYDERIGWTKPDNIHLTLRFLGDVEENKVQAIEGVLAKTAKEFQPFKFLVKELGAFPNLRQSRVLWLGIENPTNELKDLHDKVEKQLNELGFPKEKKRFNPHLTIGRVKSALSDEFMERFKTARFQENEVKVEQIILMKSELHPKGAIYTPLEKARLRQV